MSDVISLELPENPPAYTPRQELVGTLRWKRAKPFSKIELHLFWHTSGRGDEDGNVVETLEWKNPGPEGDRFFEIRLPRAPYSLKSENLQIHWRLEATGYPGKDQTSIDLVIAPDAKPVELKPVKKQGGGMAKFRKWLGLGTSTE